jgi:hypothetical protein
MKTRIFSRDKMFECEKSPVDDIFCLEYVSAEFDEDLFEGARRFLLIFVTLYCKKNKLYYRAH